MIHKQGAGAVASNAGDDFHLIWACRKLLDLLKHNSPLTAVSIEGPSWEDSIVIEDGKMLYSIDIAEYYGSFNFEQASRVVFSQLKYSSYKMDTPWTTSSLCHADNKAKSNSIIRRLADTFRGYKNIYSSAESKLELKLVSNRSLSYELGQYLSEAKHILHTKKYKKTAYLLKDLSPECQTQCEILYNTSKLGSSEFLQFFDILNFDDCGTEIRSIQKAEIAQTLGKWGIDDIHNRYNNLIMRLREMMLPESKNGYPMDRDYILAALETTNRQMFPAPNQILDISEGYIERKVGSELVNTVLANKNIFFCVHATAGIGKTTLVCNIKKYLPEGSVVVIYDCYGGGSFRQRSESRHLLEVAIPQICNSLAAECGTDWLIGSSSKEYVLLRFLLDQLKHAVENVKAINPDAVVAVIFDAVDNSKIAANFFNEDCFIDSIISEILPDGVVIIITTRSERRNLITLPENTMQFQILPFSLVESSLHLRFTFSSATEEECAEFHNLTDKNPRLQAYKISSSSFVEEALNTLRPNGITIDSLFNGFITATKQQYDSIMDVGAFFSSLINLPRPIPSQMICELFNITCDTLVSISIECNNGFYVSNEQIYLKDEDFETYLRNLFENNTVAINEIAQYMLSNRNYDAYSSRFVHIFLDKANCYDDMVKISLDEHVDTSTVGISQASKITLQRIYSTLKRHEAFEKENQLTSCKLLYRLIDLSTNDDALRDLLCNAPDEALLYCDKLSLYDIFDESCSSFSELGNAALVYSKIHDEEKAHLYIKSYIAAAAVHYNKPEKERHYPPSPEISDMVNIAEALFILGEKERAVSWIESWIPKKHQANILYKLIKRLISFGYNEICDKIIEVPWASHNKLAVVSAYIYSNLPPPHSYIDYMIRLFLKIKVIPMDIFADYHLVDFLEHLVSSGEDAMLIKALIYKIEYDIKFEYLPSFSDVNEKQQLSVALRLYVLKQSTLKLPLSVNDIIMIQGADIKDDNARKNERRKELIDSLNYLLPLYSYRYACLANKFEDFEKDSYSLISQLERNSWKSYHSYDRARLLEYALIVFSDTLLLNKVASKSTIQELLRKTVSIVKTVYEFKISLLSVIVRDKRTHQFVLEVLESVCNTLESYPAAAKEMSESYISCVRIAQQVDTQVGKTYFTKAIEWTKGLDYESYRKMHLYQEIAQKLHTANYNQPLLSYKVTRLAEDFCRKMGDTKNFPYEAAIEAATLLSQQTIWGAMCRLDDRDKDDGFSLQETLPIVLETLLKRDDISLADTIALLSMLIPDRSSAYNAIIDIVLSKMSAVPLEHKKTLLEVLIHDVLYNLPLDEKHDRCQRLVSYIDSTAYSSNLNTAEIRRMNTFLQQICNSNSSRDSSSDSSANTTGSIITTPILSMDDLENRIKSLSVQDRNSFLVAWFEELESDMYVTALDWVVNLVFGRHSKFTFESTMETVVIIVEKLHSWPDVKNWQQDESLNGKYLMNYADAFLRFYGNSDEMFAIYHRLFQMSKDNQYFVFLQHVVSDEQIYNEQIVKALCRMTDALDMQEKVTFLTWCLDTEMNKVHVISGDPKGFAPNNTNADQSDCLSSFLWRTFGHPDKRMRWRAVHTLLRSCSMGDSSIITKIIERYEESINIDYIDSKNYFFIESAKLWFLLACQRVSIELPQMLLPLYSFFKKIACAESVSHALHRRVARNICLSLAPLCAPDDVLVIANCDKSIKGVSNNKPRYIRDQHDKKYQFDFDTLDTLRYWYDDLARIFGCTQAEVAQECDFFISTFGITNQQCTDWSGCYLSSTDSYKTYNNHGVLPTIETMAKYAEWHSLFYVADKFRLTKKVVNTEFYTYEEWLDSYLIHSHGYLESEFRKHIPCIPFLWEFKKRISSDTEPIHIIPDGVDRLLVEYDGKYSLSLDGYKLFEQTVQHVCIQSALVRKGKLDDLIRKLKKPNTILSHYFYDADYRSLKKSIDIGVMKTAMEITNFPDDALDKFDVLAKDLRYSARYLMGISNSIAKRLGINKQEQTQLARSYDKSQCAVELYHWSEPENESGYKRTSTHGHLVSIEKAHMLKLLRQLECALLFELTISIEDQSHKFYGKPSKPAEKRSLFVLEADGNIKIVIDSKT